MTDRDLRIAGIKAHRDPDDNQALWKYIRQLERAQGVDLSNNKLYAVLHDDSLEGDSIFCCNFLPYAEGECQYSLLDKWNLAWSYNIAEEYGDEIQGFWVVDELTKDLCDAVVEVGMRDSYAYAANTQRKTICGRGAIKNVVWKPECACEKCR